MTDPLSPAAYAHSQRFRKVATGYPRAVALAYGRDLDRAMADDDDDVAATVAEWERANGFPVRDWQAFGATERDDDLDGALDVAADAPRPRRRLSRTR